MRKSVQCRFYSGSWPKRVEFRHETSQIEHPRVLEQGKPVARDSTMLDKSD